MRFGFFGIKGYGITHSGCRESHVRQVVLAFLCLLMGTLSLPLSAQVVASQVTDERNDKALIESAETPTIRVVPQIDIAPDVRDSLQRQFEQIRVLEEQEDAYSESLGEAYMSYGKVLASVGRLDEARDMYAAALHLIKINNGVYAVEQRPVLRSQFELHAAQGRVKQMELVLGQIAWVEKRNPEIKDEYSYDLVTRLASAFIDLYYSQPKYNEVSRMRVQKAIKHLNYALSNYDYIPLSDRLLPYGDVAMLYYTHSQINKELGQAFKNYSPVSSFRDADRPTVQHNKVVSTNFLGKAERHLKRYLYKAEQAESIEHQVRALRDLGDLYLLFDRKDTAAEYYKLSWLASSGLDKNHELVKAFENPTKLPDFNYALEHNKSDLNRRSVAVPLNFSVSSKGRVRKIYTKANDASPHPKLISRARTALKYFTFRPAIENGEMVPSDDAYYDARVRLRPGEEMAKYEASQ